MKNKKLWAAGLTEPRRKSPSGYPLPSSTTPASTGRTSPAPMAHARMLHRMGVLSGRELGAIIGGLEGIPADIDSRRFEFSASLEDIHMNIESALTERIGDAGRKLHTARSRNDRWRDCAFISATRGRYRPAPP